LIAGSAVCQNSTENSAVGDNNDNGNDNDNDVGAGSIGTGKKNVKKGLIAFLLGEGFSNRQCPDGNGDGTRVLHVPMLR
jgi:hypothetical protein